MATLRNLALGLFTIERFLAALRNRLTIQQNQDLHKIRDTFDCLPRAGVEVEVVQERSPVVPSGRESVR
jgi:hypothetical protein